MCSKTLNFVKRYFPFHLYWTDIGVNVTALSLHSYSYSRWIIPTSNTSHFIPASASLSNHFQLTKSIALSFLPLYPINLFWPFINLTGNELMRAKTKQITGTSNVIVTCLSEWVIVSIFAIFSEHFMIKRFGQMVAQDLSLRNLRQ